MSLGFTCVWDPDRDSTWSHIPANLLRSLQPLVDVVDIEAEPGSLVRRLHRRQNRATGQPEWVPRTWNNVWRTLAIRHAIRMLSPDVTLQINDLAVVRSPYWVYRDMTWEQVYEYDGDSATGIISDSLVRHARRRERRIYEHASGVFTFSEWAAQSVRGISSSRVIVVPPGINVPVRQPKPYRKKRSRLLFVGRAFARKGGPTLVDAFQQLRSRHSDIRLDIVGPSVWPLATPVPDGITFHGPVKPEDLPNLFASADLFVMPSEFEAYGIALVEALAAGLPCVARSVCAMPEILEYGELGVLAEDENPDNLAAAIEQALYDDGLHQRVSLAVERIREHYTWDRVARAMLSSIDSEK